MPPKDVFEPFSDFGYGPFPGDFHKTIPFPFQGMGEPCFVVLVMGNLRPFPADIAFGSGVILVRPNLDDPMALGLNLKTAVVVAQGAKRFFPLSHNDLLGGLQ
jgi:hypothetical protein